MVNDSFLQIMQESAELEFRYMQLNGDLYCPLVWRVLSALNKPGTSDDFLLEYDLKFDCIEVKTVVYVLKCVRTPSICADTLVSVSIIIVENLLVAEQI
jgi:hypothetical protein